MKELKKKFFEFVDKMQNNRSPKITRDHIPQEKGSQEDSRKDGQKVGYCHNWGTQK